MSPRLRKIDPKMKVVDMEGLWKASDERAELLAVMSQSEIKRRRYDKWCGATWAIWKLKLSSQFFEFKGPTVQFNEYSVET